MKDNQLKVIIGGLLHDVGKILYRASDGRNHSQSGYEFLKNELKIADADILDQVHYHHAGLLKNAGVADNSLAYITYIADNIAAAADRREKTSENYGFDKNMALESVFNILNGNHGTAVYHPETLEPTGKINFPETEKIIFDESFYQKIENDLKNVLHQLEYKDSYVNSLLEVMEAITTYIPSSTSKKERADISLFDHVKLTVALGSCILEYLETENIKNYKEELFLKAKDFYEKPAFLLFSMDVSGIQSFIYNIQSENALKNLRARSLYLEILLENAIDELLDQVGISRANLIYSGGGHAYLLFPNTENAKQALEQFQINMNDWFLERFQTELYIGCAYVPCSAKQLQNEPRGSYKELFAEISRQISEKKMHRYDAKKIFALNHSGRQEHERECRICHRSEHLTEDNLCEICSGLLNFSGNIHDKEFFTVLSKTENKGTIPVFRERYLLADEKETLKKRIASQPEYIRSYSKNDMYTGDSVATKLWVGDYKSADTFHDLLKEGTGIKRLGVLRADVDNLGHAFVAGFESEENKDDYVTLSRTAAFSRKLSLFFKLHMNDILKHAQYHIPGNETAREYRNAAIVYSGGDDVFVTGEWLDILEFAIDLHHNLEKYTQGTLKISAGFGVFKEKYPISYMADQTGALEDASKSIADEKKNAITLFDENHTYHWDELVTNVLEDKYRIIHDFFQNTEERGKSFLYHLLELFRNRTETINLARLAYLLSRMEPEKDAAQEEKDRYYEFSRKIYDWQKNEKDAREAITAIYIYAYTIRSEEEQE